YLTAYSKTYPTPAPTSDPSWSTGPILPFGSGDGSYNYRITLTTSSGLSAILYRSAIYDSTAPTLTVTTPLPGSWTSSSSATFMGTGGDGSGSGIASVYYLVDAAANDHSLDVASWDSGGGLGAPTSSN